MNTKALRQKILDLAIRGKLVPQDPNDEPASVLLERIRAEKQQMVKDGRLKAKDIKNDTVIFLGDDNLHYEKFPDGTVKCIEDEIPFELPEGWEWTRLGFAFSHNTGKALNKSKTEGTMLTYITTSNLYWNRFEIDKLKSMPFTDAEVEKCTVRKGDLLVCEGGDIGRAAIWNYDDEIRIQNHIHRVRAYIELNIEFYYHVFYLYKLTDMISGKGIGIQGLSSNQLHSIPIPLPPIQEQHRIIVKLNELLSFVDIIESDKTDLQTTIQLTKSKILDLAIRGKLVPQNPDDEPASVLLDRIRAEKEELIKQGKIKRDKKESVIYKGDDNSYYEKIGDTVTCIDEELPFELPDGWIWCRGSSCFLPMESRKPSGTYFKYIDIDSIDNKHQAIKEAKITETAKAPSRANRAVFDGSILFSLVRPYLKNIALVDSNNADSIASTGFYIATSNGTFIPKYLYILMISACVVDGLNQFLKGDNSPSISKDNIEKWLYPVPPLAEQEKIADTAQKYISILEDIEKSLS